MKKIVGILGMAAVLASGAFAAEPTADFKIAEFTGSAEFGWKADFTNSNAVTMGMYNSTAANLKLGFITAGDKSTTGDGIWGELKIKVGATTVDNGAIKLGDKDYKPGTLNNDTAKNEGPLFTRADAGKDLFLNLPGLFPVAAVETAKIHFVDGDFAFALNILKPSLKYGEFKAPSATGKTAATDKIGDDTNMAAGFGLELAMKDMFGLNFKLMDNGAEVKADAKKFGMAFDASLNAVPNLTAKVMGTFNFSTEYTGMAVEAGYKFNINDTLYLKPGAAFTTEKKKNADATNYLEAGVLLGWGAVDQEPKFANVTDKTSEGFSVSVGNNLASGNGKTNTTSLYVGAYDQSLFKFLNLEDFGTLKLGLQNVTTISSTKNTNEAKLTTDVLVVNNVFGFGAKYSVSPDPVYIDLGFDLGITGNNKTTKLSGEGSDDKATKESYETADKAAKVEPKPVFAWTAKIGSKKIIDNTDVYALYEGGYSAVTNAVTANKLTIGTKISF